MAYTTRLLAQLTADGLLPPAQAASIADDERTRPFSLHYELRALLYLGSVLLVGGLGVLIYENRDSLGQEAITALIALLMAGIFAYAARHRPAFTWGEAPRTSIAADYLLLLGCLLFLVLEGYVQYAYGVFGTRYGLVTLLPAALFFGLAYRYDHRGVLSMAVTALAAWVGVSVAPLAVFQNADYFQAALSRPALGLGLVLVAAGLASERWRLKAHFAYTYLLLGSNLALLAATNLFFERTGLAAFGCWLLVLGICAGLFWYARRTQSYLFLLLAVGYGYVVGTAGLYRLLAVGQLEDLLFGLGTLYFPLTLGALVLFFVKIKKILRLK
ncbi:hypothetical protein A0257_19145 [Hymenobacter psoromatis]|nr:hypothetical protein A0257_19145 [Hymenobacter psoromatis]